LTKEQEIKEAKVQHEHFNISWLWSNIQKSLSVQF